MKNEASSLWLRISLHGTKGFRQDWLPFIDGLGKANKGLFLPKGLSTVVPCGSDNCMEGCYAEVQELNGKFRAVCPKGNKKLFEVPRENIVLHEIHTKVLHRLLAQALSLNDEYVAFSENSRLFRVGRSPQAQEFPRPYYLSYGYAVGHIKAALAYIQADAADSRFVLLMANSKAHTPSLDNQIAKLGGELKSLRDLVDVTASGIIAKSPGLVKEETPEYRPAAKFPTPAGCTWANIRIEFIADDEVSISAPGIKGQRYSYIAMGMQNHKKTGLKQHTQQWTVLGAFARGEGCIPYRIPQKEAALKKQKQLLSDALSEFFGISGPPIIGRKGEYICQFHIVPNRKTERKTSYSQLGMASDSALFELDDDYEDEE